MVSNLLLGRRKFFNDQTRHWIPACLTIGVPIPFTISNVDSNSDFALVYVVTVALDKPGSVVVFPSISDPQHCVNRQGEHCTRRRSSRHTLTNRRFPGKQHGEQCHPWFYWRNNPATKHQNPIIGFLVYLNDLFHPVRIPVDKNIPSFVNAHS